MTRDEFKVLCKAMKAVYTQDNFLPDQDAFNVWFALLEDLPYKVANLAVQKYMVTEHFPPTIADIRNQAHSIASKEMDELNEAAAWDMARKACSNSLYHAKEEFEKLPVAVQRAIGSPGALRELGQMDSDALNTVEKSHFVRTYRAEIQKIRDEAKLPPSMRQQIGEVKSVCIEGSNGTAQIGVRDETGDL